ncbi:type 1 fimbrial protein [Trinickia violacea]|uniref:Type 1 fimbrial protein n=1 Tax=Trinickia violacea TaxID=2571746 RepID=A0A4P8IVM1_9BURK|nr:fimbrial protein [Trinickia violacea]QCP51174.1 type 1 fimbrial protein [Trinickia violacea]
MNNLLSIAVLVATSLTRMALLRWARNGLAAVGLLAAFSSPASAASFTMFGSSIVVPSRPAAGTIVARDYLTTQQVCGAAQCSLGGGTLSLYPNGGSSSVTGPDISTNIPGLNTRILFNGVAQRGGMINMTITAPVEVQLVATGSTISSGSLAGTASSPEYFIYANDYLRISLSAKVTVVDGTCSVPNQTITLLPTSSTKFTGVGNSQGTQSFNLNFTNCPAGFNRVGYSLVPVGSETTVPGALPLSTGSTATGARIRVANASGNPVTFNTSIPLTAYSQATGGSYSVPYQASYVQTGTSVKPGTVNGQMQVLLDYQ